MTFKLIDGTPISCHRPPDLSTRGFTLVELMIVISTIATLSAIAIPGAMSAHRSTNERSAATSLRTVLSAESDFKLNDRDGNKVSDYWTRDVAGFYGMTSALQAGRNDPALKLIDLSMAQADAAPIADGSAGGHYSAIRNFVRVQSPKAGYWYYAMVNDGSVNPAEAYAVNTGGSVAMGAVHHMGKFAFLAFPDVYSSSGKRVFILNEAGTVFARDPTRSIKASVAVPPGAPLAAWRNWPTDAALRALWKASP